MAAVPVLRAVTRLRREVRRLPGNIVAPARAESGGQGAAPTGISKTSVPFPVKVSDFRDSVAAAAGEISAEVATLVPEPDESVRQESSVDPESADREPPQQEDSSSSSSSDSDSDEEPGVSTPPPGKGGEKDPADGKSSSGDQNVLKEEQAAPEREGNEIRPEQGTGGEDGADLPIASQQLLHSPVKAEPRGGRALAGEEMGEDFVEVPPEMTPTGGQAITGEDGGREDLVEVPPEMTPRGGHIAAKDGEKEELVDVAPEVTPRGGQTVTGEELVDVAPALGTEEPLQTSVVTAVGGDLAGEKEDPRELSASSEEPRPSGSPDLSAAACEEIPEGEESAASLTPPPPAAPAPAEPFDNSRYQNEQHFSYNPFTFVDYDLELARFRLPQPSSGRPSHRH